MRARAALVIAVAGLTGAALASCETVDLGSPPSDINVCRPSVRFFVDEIWPNVLAKDYGGKRCFDAQCHDPGSGRPLTLVPNPMPAINPGDALPDPLPDDWAKNYRSTTNQMNCANVTASDLILLPTNQRTHGGGQLFAPTAPEVTLITNWVSQ
jgi:hypothetical protein